jgi:hypothetical protein
MGLAATTATAAPLVLGIHRAIFDGGSQKAVLSEPSA